MIEHLAFTEFDMAGITNTVTRYKEAGLQADFDINDKQLGVVGIALENPIRRDGTIVIFEIHKLAKPGLFGRKAHWVVQLYSQDGGPSSRIKRGCVAASMQAYAISSAEKDLYHGFVSVADFDLAAIAY
jgi:hypothetical protein